MTRTLTQRQSFAIGAVLALAMAATRYHHFGSSLSLPDASLAVFFLAGFYLRRVWPFAGLLALAALADYAAISGGVSGWCVTAAYPFLTLAYGSLWLAGRWCARRHEDGWRALPRLAVAVLAGTGGFFLISNGSFYLLSGYFPDLSWTEYAGSVTRYFPAYLMTTALYVGIAACLHAAAVALGGAVRGSHPAG